MGSRNARCMLFLVMFWGFAIVTVLYFGAYNADIGGKKFKSFLGGHGPFLRNSVQGDVLPTHVIANCTSDQDEGVDPADLFDVEPRVDKSPALSEAAIVEEVQRRVPSLPIAYWYLHKNSAMRYKNDSCAKFPNILELEFNNIYWQVLLTSNGTFQLYGAYYDDRKLSKIAPAVRILGMINRIEPTVETYCQLWFESLKEPVFSKVTEYKYIWNRKWGNYKQDIYQPYLITCQIPDEHRKRVPASVSVVEKRCNRATNNLRIIYNKPEKKKDFAVCVKGLDFLHQDLSVRLVEWIELISILGADKIFFYELQVHPNISKVLRHYEKLGRVDITPITLAGGQPNAPGLQHMYLAGKINHKRQNEVIPYNDCFYKNLFTYRYIVLLDIDEVIMPLNTNSWKELMDAVEIQASASKSRISSYHARNVYFLDDVKHEHDWFKDVPKYMHMLQHIYRSTNYTKPGHYVKCFHDTERVLTLHNHFPFACLGSGCVSFSISTSDAQLQHYRADCVRNLKNACVEYRKNSTLDTTIWKFKNTLIKHTTDTLKELGFFRFKKTKSQN